MTFRTTSAPNTIRLTVFPDRELLRTSYFLHIHKCPSLSGPTSAKTPLSAPKDTPFISHRPALGDCHACSSNVVTSLQQQLPVDWAQGCVCLFMCMYTHSYLHSYRTYDHLHMYHTHLYTWLQIYPERLSSGWSVLTLESTVLLLDFPLPRSRNVYRMLLCDLAFICIKVSL